MTLNPDPGGTADLFRAIFDAVPLPLFRVGPEVEILDLNRAASKVFDTTPAQAMRRRGGDVMHCINTEGAPDGCGSAKPCADCLIRNGVREVFTTGHPISRQRTAVEMRAGEAVVKIDLLLTITPVEFPGEKSALLCLEDISELTSLRSLVPICASCKKIRDDRQLWNSVEHYFSRFMQVDFTHSICPDCARRLYPQFYEQDPKQ